MTLDDFLPEKCYTLYHGTCSDILTKTGWEPNKVQAGSNMGQTRYLYLSSHPDDARWFANEKGCDVVLVVKDIPASFLRVDPEDGIADTVDDELNNKLGLPGKVVLTKPLAASHFYLLDI